MKTYFALQVNFKNGDSRVIGVFDNVFFANERMEMNQRYYNNSLSVVEVEDDKTVVRFSQNGPRHHGKYQTRAFIYGSIEDMKNNMSIMKELKTSRFNTEEGVDSEAQRSYLLEKIKRQYGDNIFCIY